MATKRRASLAKHRDALGHDLARDLLRHYGAHEPFIEDVESVVQQHNELIQILRSGTDRGYQSWAQLLARTQAMPTLSAYLTALQQTAAHWGLDRFPDDLGFKALHLWVLRWRGERKPTAPFGTGIIWRSPALPDIPVDRTVKIAVCDTWDPTEEPLRDPKIKIPLEYSQIFGHRSYQPPHGARERLLERCRQAVEAELERIAVAFEQSGFIFEDSSPQRERHLDWTFLRLALRQPVRTIADLAGADRTEGTLSENAVRKETERIAKIIGLAKFPTANRLSEK